MLMPDVYREVTQRIWRTGPQTHAECNAWCDGDLHAVLLYALHDKEPVLCDGWAFDGRRVEAVKAEPALEAPPAPTPDADPGKWTAWTVWFRWGPSRWADTPSPPEV